MKSPPCLISSFMQTLPLSQTHGKLLPVSSASALCFCMTRLDGCVATDVAGWLLCCKRLAYGLLPFLLSLINDECRVSICSTFAFGTCTHCGALFLPFPLHIPPNVWRASLCHFGRQRYTYGSIHLLDGGRFGSPFKKWVRTQIRLSCHGYVHGTLTLTNVQFWRPQVRVGSLLWVSFFERVGVGVRNGFGLRWGLGLGPGILTQFTPPPPFTPTPWDFKKCESDTPTTRRCKWEGGYRK